jgi:thiosulfate reductase cytochrome b subunit
MVIFLLVTELMMYIYIIVINDHYNIFLTTQ